jgi:hypothetical protein
MPFFALLKQVSTIEHTFSSSQKLKDATASKQLLFKHFQACKQPTIKSAG